VPTPKLKRITKERIIAALKSGARKLGHTPSSVELWRLSGITHHQVAWRFRTYRAAVTAAGLLQDPNGLRIEASTLLEDGGKVVRKLGAVPSGRQYKQAGNYSRDCFAKHFQAWSRVPMEFSRFVTGGGLAGDWTDVLEKIRRGPIPVVGLDAARAANQAARLAREARAKSMKSAQPNEARPPQEAPTPQVIDILRAQIPPPLHGMKCITATMLAVFIAEIAPSGLQWITAACFPRRPLKDRPLLGAPTRLRAFPYEPVNEMGVMVLFSMLAERLGFVIESVQSWFPDCQAKIEVEPGRWQHFRIEFEYESLQFKKHGHDPSQCDLIVCWRHNWKNCPPNLQVLELSKIVQSFTN
jgi:HNH endonuclease